MNRIIFIVLAFLSFPCFSMLIDESPVPDVHAAAYNGKFLKLKKIITLDNINSRDQNQRTPLHHAVLGHKIKSVKVLVENGADINSEDQQKLTPFFYSCQTDNLELVKYLLSNGAQVEGSNGISFTPLNTAVSHDSIEIVHYLLENYPYINKLSGNSALFYAVGNYEMTTLLLEWEADVNYFTDDVLDNTGKVLFYGQSILHRAIFYKNPDIVNLLLKYGADVYINKNDGRTTLQLAKDSKNRKIVKLIEDAYYKD